MAAKKKPAKKATSARRKPVKKPAKKPAASKAARKPSRAARTQARKTAPSRKPAKKKAAAAKKPVAAKKPAPVKKAVVVAKPAPKPAAKVAVKPAPRPAARPTARAVGKIAAIRLTPAPPREFKRPPASDRDYMNPRQIEAFRKQLLDWKRSLMEEVDRTVHHMQDEASNFPDPNDRATQEEEFALELRARDRERKLIKKIDEALLSLDTGDYGYCEICGVEIGIKRLEARPTATLCIDCKNLEEIKERQYG